MRRSAVVWVLMAGGCLDKNPVFVDETETGGAPGTTTQVSGSETTAKTSTDANQTTDVLPTTGSPDTEGTGPIDSGEITGDTEFTLTGTTGPGETTDISGSTIIPNICGDGEVGPGEECDDGNKSDNDECLSDCVAATCGDGILQEMTEECDDGNNVETDACQPNTCKATPPRFVFVTSVAYPVDMLGGVLGADQRCNERAQAAGLPGPYQAWISDDQNMPSMRMTQYKVPYVNTKLELIAIDWSQLASVMHKLPINIDEKGAPAPNSSFGECGFNGVWTNTDEQGDLINAAEDCMNWTAPEGVTTWGSTKPFNMWSNDCTNPLCHLQAPLFCVQQ